VVAAFLPAMVAVTAPVAVPTLLGERWSQAVPLLQILSIPATIGLATTVVGAALRALGRPRRLLLVTSLSISMQVAGLLIGMPGLVTAVLGWAIGAIVGFGLTLAVAARTLHMPARVQLRPLWIVIPPVVALVFMAQTMLWLLSSLGPTVQLFAALVAGGGAYGAVLRLTGRDEWHWILRQVGGLLGRLIRQPNRQEEK
jgi:O-antigen/teichoic acid export membrane protein